MKKTRSTVFKTTLMLLATFSLVIAANAGYIAVQPEKQEIKATGNAYQSEFYAEISFYIYEGDGCACVPVRNAPIFAQGLDTDHNDSGFTDDDGLCILELEYDATYRVTLEMEAFQMVLFDFVVIDDQTFTFHMQEEDTSTPNLSLLQMFVQKISHLKNL
jgi:hypothetical protein